MSARGTLPGRFGLPAAAFAAGVLVGAGLAIWGRSGDEGREAASASAGAPAGETAGPEAASSAPETDSRRRVASLERRIAYLERANAELLQRLRAAEGGAGGAAESGEGAGPAARPAAISRGGERPSPAGSPDPEEVPETPPGPLVGSDLSINEDAAEGKYTDYERQGLERILLETRRRLDQVEAGHVALVRREPDKVVLRIGSFYDEGERIANEFREKVVLLLGEERAREFLEILEPRVRSHLSGFGSLPRQVTITPLESGGYLIGIRTEMPDGRGGTAPRSFRSHMVRELPRLYREYF